MRKRILPLAIFLVLSFFLILFSSHVSFLFDFVSHTVSPVRGYLYSRAHAETKPTENDLLKKENLKLKARLVEMNALKKDNEALRGQFQDTTLPSSSLLPAQVIGFKGSPDTLTTLILDQGSKSGVKKGMAGVSGHVLVGKVGKVTLWSSELIVTSSRNFSTLGVTSGGNSPGIISGEEDFILFDNVAITDDLSKGDIVITKGEVKNGVTLPANLIIGQIVTVHKSETSPFQSGIVKSPINIKKLTTVFLVM